MGGTKKQYVKGGVGWDVYGGTKTVLYPSVRGTNRVCEGGGVQTQNHTNHHNFIVEQVHRSCVYNNIILNAIHTAPQ